MFSMKAFVCVWVCLLQLVNIGASQIIFNGTAETENKTLVRPPAGIMSGFLMLRNNVNITCYLGIPYARPPVGTLRFVKPRALSPWTTPFKAVHANRICMQANFDDFHPERLQIVRHFMREDPKVIDYYRTDKSEDCLQLSIFTRNLGNVNKTVVVWIHGGGFVTGTSAFPDYDYPGLAAMDDNLIVVAVNYRLNVFGFISSGTGALPANLGLHDQILALKWIQTNIAAFGGDPGRVVLWGQSAGSVSVGYHFMSNASSPLFKRAIMESGSALLPLSLADDNYRQAAYEAYLKLTDCMASQGNDNALECLQNKTTREITSAYQSLFLRYPLAFLPNANDTDLFEFSSFWSGMKQSRLNRHKDILIGTNADEGAQYAKIGPLHGYYHFDHIDTNFTRANVVKTLKDSLKHFPVVEEMVEPIVDLLVKNVRNVSDPGQMWARYVELVSDMVFVCPDYHFLTAYSSNNPNSSLYYYRFSPRVSHPVECPVWSAGACHTDELQFVFGIPELYAHTQQSYPQDELELSKWIAGTWLQFAHHGQLTALPDRHVYKWQPFTDVDVQYLEIHKAFATMVKGFPAHDCQDIFPMLLDLLEDMQERWGER